MVISEHKKSPDKSGLQYLFSDRDYLEIFSLILAALP